MSSSDTTISALLSTGIALSLSPPSTEIIQNGSASCSSNNSLPSKMFALARPLSISEPECPPTRPWTGSVIAVPSAEAQLIGRNDVAFTPPAQPARKCPSSSESRFKRYFAFRSAVSSAMAPSMPTSSSVVKTTSSSGCSIVLSSRIANPMATAMPSSPPRVVPFAWTYPSSTTRFSPSFSKSKSTPASLTHTISRCPWSIRTGASP